MQTVQAHDTDSSALDLVHRFNDAWNARDIDQVLAMVTADCVFENTSPPPDGERFTGRTAIREIWMKVIQTPGMRFETEHAFACGDRVTALWRYAWTNSDGSNGHVRGIDLFRIRDGLIAEKLSYVKG